MGLHRPADIGLDVQNPAADITPCGRNRLQVGMTRRVEIHAVSWPTAPPGISAHIWFQTLGQCGNLSRNTARNSWSLDSKWR
jgi:hypothetical protein